MLDENLPTFRFKSSSDNPLSSVLYLSQRGDEPTPEYLFRRPDPALPASRDKYAAALCDAYNPDVVYAEVTVDPDWVQPTLSAAEIRAQSQSGAPPTVATATIPDNFAIQLYNPDQSVAIKMVQGGWNKTDSWEFELPVQTFKMPSTSELDRDPGRGSPADLVPRIMFRWKKDGKLSRDMTCYMCGKNLGGRKNKEPDITIAFFKASRDSTVTIYEPNLHRVEIEDRKGLELVLLFGAEIIKELYINPKPDVFNVSGSGAAVISANGGKRKNSRPSGGGATPPAAAMSGALGNATPSSRPPPAAQQASAIPPSTHTPPGPSSAEIEAETRRLQAMVEREEREREKRERAEQKRIKKMLEEEEKEARRREAEIAKETERLRKKYGIEGQALPSSQASPTPPAAGHNPPLPPRTNHPQTSPPQFAPPPPHWGQQQNQNLAAPALPPRPLSAGPGGPGGGGGGGGGGHNRPFHSGILNNLWHGHIPLVGSSGGGGGGNPPPPPHMSPPGGRTGGGGRRRSDEERRKVQRKRSMGW